MSQLIEDSGWDKEIVPGGTPTGYRQIRSKLVNQNLIAYLNRNTYIYLLASNSWAVLVSFEAQVQVCSITGNENASVNYLSATKPYANFLQNNAIIADSAPLSICIGTRRLRISYDEATDTLRLTKCQSLIPLIENIDERVGELCIMPCMFHQYMDRWQPGGAEKIFNYLVPLFPESIELETLMWLLANIVVDPSSMSKFVLLYGPGGTGKSTVIHVVEDLFKGCCGIIKSSTLTDLRGEVSIDTAVSIASNRVLTVGDINLTTSKLNLHVVKELTGHDSIAVPPLRVATHCSVIGACNYLPHLSTQREWVSNAISRRAVVLIMNVRSNLIPKVDRPQSVEDNLDFLMKCVHRYISHPYMPISTRCLMYTLLGEAYGEISDKIIIGSDVSIQETFDANTEIELYFSLELHILGELASLVSPPCVLEYGTVYFIKNIKLKESLIS